ncbi:MAG TPA: aspartyl/asparaginyl beta-hydroxylase domain-containing protein [Longimicrobium sp.]
MSTLLEEPTATPAAPAAPPAGREPWYMINGGRYPGEDPFFYEREQFPWVKTLEDNWEAIRDEIQALLASGDRDRVKPYFNRMMVFPPRHWKTMGFYFWGFRMHGNCRRCPTITRVLESIPGMTAGSLSMLEPGSNINPHQGDTNAIIRSHLGLIIPTGLPECGFQVGPEIRPWEEGKMLLFCDAHTHTAWNHSKERRLILIVDVMLPEFAARRSAICSHVLASSLMQRAYQNVAVLNRFPGSLQYALHALTRAFIRGILPIQRRLGR